MRIPEVRGRFDKIIKLMLMMAREMEVLHQELHRRPVVKRADDSSEPMTPMLSAAIRVYAIENPDLTQMEVGKHFNVSQGRVSEAMRGKRQ